MRNTILLLFLITYSFLKAQIPTEELIGYWPFSGNANDESSNNYHGTIYGAISTEDRFGNPNSAYHFDGVDDYIYITNSSLITQDQLTVSCWFKAEENTRSVLVATGNQNDYQIAVENDEIWAFIVTNGSGASVPKTKFSKSDWHHAVLRYNGVNLDLFMDNILVQSTITTGNIYSAQPDNLTFGGYTLNGTPYDNFFQGSLDDIRIYSSALTDEEISILFNEDKDYGLIAYYPFNGNANDESGNNHHGTVYGAELTTDRLGNSNSAYSFNGIDSYINLGVLSSYKSHTFSGWFKIQGQQSGWGVLVSKLYDDGTNPFTNSEVRITPDYGTGYKFSSQLGTGTQWVGNQIESSIEEDDWHYFVYQYDDDLKKIKLYWNNTLIDNISINDYLEDASTPLHIGARPNHNGVRTYFFNGKIDDVKIYNRAITAEEISDEYQSGVPTKIKNQRYSNSSCIYPNPSQGIISINGVYNNHEILVFDLTGKQVFRQKINTSQAIDLTSHCSSGVYLMKIVDSNFNTKHSSKLIIN